ncbi:unnamed protein product [Allacma fusca]|uniref:Uncharacterized protein n=1 Tax=Allacma fusca TaxID=39272 RepID=A0A8J2LIN4_9HEXA|nr:unnamed protein product [Allacma fusca]
MSRSFDYVSPFGRPIVSTRTYREPGSITTVTESVTTRSRPIYETISPFARVERISDPPSTRLQSSNRTPAGAGVVTSSSEYERGPDGRPSHFSSTVYKSPYGKTYRFTSHY